MSQQQPVIYEVEMPDGTIVEVEGAPNPEAARDFVRQRMQQGQAEPQQANAQTSEPQIPDRFREQVVSPPSRTFLNIGGQRMLRNMTPFPERQAQLQSGLEEGGLPGWAAYAPATFAARGEQLARVLGSGAGQAARGLMDLGDTLSPANAANTLMNRYARDEDEQREYRSPLTRATDQIPVPEVTGNLEEVGSAIVQFGIPGLTAAKGVSRGATALRSALPALGDEAAGVVGRLQRAGRGVANSRAAERGAQVVASGAADAAAANPRGQDRIALTDPGRGNASDLERRGSAFVEGSIFAGALSALAPIGKGAVDYVTNTLRDSFRGAEGIEEQLAVMLALSDGGRKELTQADAAGAIQLADMIRENTARLRSEGVDRITLGALLELPPGASPELEGIVTRAQNFYRTALARDTGEVIAAERSMAQQMADNLEGQLARPGDQTASVAAAQDRSAAQAASFANLASAQGRAAEQAAEGAAQVAESAQSSATPSRAAATASRDFSETLAGPQGAEELSEMGAIGAVRQEARDRWAQSDAIKEAIIAPVGRSIRRTINSLFPAPGTGKRPRSGGGDVRDFTLVQQLENAGADGRTFLENARSIANRAASGDLEFGEISALRRSMRDAEEALLRGGKRQAAQELRAAYNSIYEEAIEGIRQGSPDAAQIAERAVSFTRDQAPRIAGAGLPQAAITSAQRAGEFINPEQVLGRFMGSMRSSSGGGATLAAQLQDMRALIGEFSGKGAQDSADQAIRDYVRANFAEVAFRQGSDGSIIPNPGAAVRFIRQNKGTLDELNLTAELRAASQGVSEASARFREGLERAKVAEREAAQSQQMSDMYRANRAPNDPTQVMAAPGGSVEAAVFDAAKGGREGLETLDRLMAEAGGEQAQAGVRNAISNIVLREIMGPDGRISRAGLGRLFGRNAKETNVRRIFDYAYPDGREARTAQRYFRFLQNQNEAKNTAVRTSSERNIKEGTREVNVVFASIFGIVEGRGITSIMSRVQRQAFWGGRKVEDVVAEAASFMAANPERMEIALRAAAGNRQAKEHAIRLADMFIANNIVSAPQGAPEMEPAQ
jgi:hypothetical protein